MKKIFSEIFSLVLFPILLAINFYTGHYGPIFILNCIYIVAGLLMGVGIWLLFSNTDPKMADAFAKGYSEIVPWRRVLAYFYWSIAAGWFIYFEYYGSFVLLVVYIFLHRFYIYCMKVNHANRSRV